jgi:hypothetical protein
MKEERGPRNAPALSIRYKQQAVQIIVVLSFEKEKNV